MYNPDNIRRRQKDRTGSEGGADAQRDDRGEGATLSVSAATAMPNSPVFEVRPRAPSRAGVRRGRPGGIDLALRRSFQPVVAEVLSPAVVEPPPSPDRHERVARLFTLMEQAVIPRLVRYDPATLHHPALTPTAAEFDEFFDRLLQDDEAGLVATIDRLHGRGLSMRTLFMDLLVPASRRMGERWCDDTSDFVAVTVAVSQLQRLVQHYSATFCAEGRPLGRGHRILLAQPRDETHGFGLTLVAEFFRCDGWDVVVSHAGNDVDPVQRVRAEHFDAVGLSIGSMLNLPWLRDRIPRLRRESCNASVVVMVGGPVFSGEPDRVASVGADLTAGADEAPARVLEHLTQRERDLPPSGGA